MFVFDFVQKKQSRLSIVTSLLRNLQFTGVIENESHMKQ